MIDAPAPAPRVRQGKTALVLASVSLVLSLISCGVTGLVASTAGIDLLPVQSKPVEADAAQVEAVAHVTLPPGTVLLAAAYSNGLETHLSAKFRIPRTALDAFVAAGKFTAPPTPGLRAVTAEQNVGGGNLWDPGTAVSVAGIKEEQPTADGTYRSVLFNLDAPDAVTVYLYAGRG
ncbi:hypothetical protein ABT369_22290 [Dactylosporangium sp. NPDC000244]|uniref:hypothetical protein n=1 Tax=Dactylosporangium sp. NPDC000244 TaxID=3154365 RepID=UPI00331FC753